LQLERNSVVECDFYKDGDGDLYFYVKTFDMKYDVFFYSAIKITKRYAGEKIDDIKAKVEDFRDGARDTTESLKEKAGESYEEMKEGTRKYGEKARKVGEDISEKLKGKYDSARKTVEEGSATAAEDIARKGKGNYEKVKEKIEDTIENVKETLSEKYQGAKETLKDTAHNIKEKVLGASESAERLKDRFVEGGYDLKDSVVDNKNTPTRRVPDITDTAR